MTGLPPVARNTDPHTSHQAARAIRPKRPSQMLRLLAVYANYHHGVTDEGAAASAGISHQSATKRCADLRALELIRPTGEVATSSAGMDARICAITMAGQEALASGRPLTRPSPEPEETATFVPAEYARGRAEALDSLIQHIDAMRATLPRGSGNLTHHETCWQRHPVCALTMLRGDASRLKATPNG